MISRFRKQWICQHMVRKVRYRSFLTSVFQLNRVVNPHQQWTNHKLFIFTKKSHSNELYHSSSSWAFLTHGKWKQIQTSIKYDFTHSTTCCSKRQRLKKKHSNAILHQVSKHESDKALTNLGFLKLSTNISGNYSPEYNPDTESATLSLTTIFSKKADDIIIKDIQSSQLHHSGLKIVVLCTWTMSVLHKRCFSIC